MSTVSVMPRDGEWTVDDLRHLPDDGLQYELAEGLLLVTPAPRVVHQRVVRDLTFLLKDLVPEDCELLFAPVDFQPTDRTSLQPDLLVVRREDVEEMRIRAPLVLAVEVLSPSTRAKDLLLKRSLYATSGVAHYWVFDPVQPSLTAWELEGDAYVEVGRAVGEERLVLERPFRVVVTPNELMP